MDHLRTRDHGVVARCAELGHQHVQTAPCSSRRAGALGGLGVRGSGEQHRRQGQSRRYDAAAPPAGQALGIGEVIGSPLNPANS